jgi:hypothetical protein
MIRTVQLTERAVSQSEFPVICKDFTVSEGGCYRDVTTTNR